MIATKIEIIKNSIKTKTFKKVTECKRQGKKLLEIESQEENNMLSELLYSSSRVTNVMDEVIRETLPIPKTSKSQVWTGGVGSNIARKNVWFWHNNTDKVKKSFRR